VISELVCSPVIAPVACITTITPVVTWRGCDEKGLWFDDGARGVEILRWGFHLVVWLNTFTDHSENMSTEHALPRQISTVPTSSRHLRARIKMLLNLWCPPLPKLRHQLFVVFHEGPAILYTFFAIACGGKYAFLPLLRFETIHNLEFGDHVRRWCFEPLKYGSRVDLLLHKYAA